MNKWEMIKAFALRIRKNEEGVTAIEYGLIATLIGVAIITTVTTVGTALSAEFTAIAAKFPG